MAISRFDSPAQAEFMQTYVPIPFQELDSAGAAMQQRWEEGDAWEQGIETELGNISALEYVTDTAGNYIPVGSAKLARAEADKFSARLGDITKNFPNKASMEHRAALKSLIADLRKSKSSTGLLGRLEADVQRYKAFEEERKKADVGSKVHRGWYQDMQLAQFAEASQGEDYVPFAVAAPMLKNVNVHEELDKTLKNMNDVILNMPGVDANYAKDQIARTGFIQGVSYERAFSTALDLIVQNTDLLEDIKAQAAYSGRDPEEMIKDIASTMANVYTKQTGNVSWTTDELAIHAQKKSMDEVSFAIPLNLPVPGKPYGSIKGLTEEVSDRKEQINTVRDSAVEALVATWGVPKENITVDRVTGEISVNTVGVPNINTGEELNAVDVGKVVLQYNAEIRQNKKALQDMERLRENLEKKHGITEEYRNTEEYKNDFKKAAKRAVMKKQFFKAIFEGSSGLDAVIADESEILKELASVNSRFKAVDGELKKMQDRGTSEVMAVNVPKDLKTYMQDMVINHGRSGISVEYADGKNSGELDKAAKESYVLNTKFPPVYTGHMILDPADGKMKGLYNVFDKKGNEVGMVKTHAPKGTERYLYKAGLIDEYETYIQSVLYNELEGILGTNGAGSGVLDLTDDFKPQILNREASGAINAVIKVKDKNGNVRDLGQKYSNEGEMITHFSALYRASVEKSE